MTSYLTRQLWAIKSQVFDDLPAGKQMGAIPMELRGKAIRLLLYPRDLVEYRKLLEAVHAIVMER